MSVEETNTIERRDFLRRAAITGATAVWVPPLIQSMTASAGAVTPRLVNLQGISFVAFCFTCAGVTYSAKVEAPGRPGARCEGPLTTTGETCGVSCPGSSSGCARFTLIVTGVNEDNEVSEVQVLLQNCTFLAGAAKCGAADGGCHEAVVDLGGMRATFACD